MILAAASASEAVAVAVDAAVAAGTAGVGDDDVLDQQDAGQGSDDCCSRPAWLLIHCVKPIDRVPKH